METTTKMTLPLSVVVADDHHLFRQGLIGLMNTRPDLVRVVGEAATGREAVSLAAELEPDLVLMDIAMPDGNGLQATEQIHKQLANTAVVILTASEEDKNLHRAVRLGAAGYLLKSLDAEELFELIGGVASGEAAITRTMAARLLKGLADDCDVETCVDDLLTEREIEVLRLVAQGVSNPDIAERLFITVNTVKTHLRNILDKLQLENRTQAATYAVQKGLISPFDE
ncbi:MAG TPA: response regulator transcription factor [Candidatus Sulfomarinibacteraceae bacterium]|nr:response regulator transcription factor [Candidatus Sulfomarinibacteraceae bacterium]